MIGNPNKKYCLDANVLIQAWQKYYSPKICPDYWDILNQLGSMGRIFIPKAVFEEITRTEDDLCAWIKNSSIPVRPIDREVTTCLSQIYAADHSHTQLVDNTKNRSLADPWVIAHALREDACVVTKEEKMLKTATPKIKIPNVCENMGISCINDFQFVDEVNIRFSCRIH